MVWELYDAKAKNSNIVPVVSEAQSSVVCWLFYSNNSSFPKFATAQMPTGRDLNNCPSEPAPFIYGT